MNFPEVIKAGVIGKEPDLAARAVIDGAGYAGTFGHSLGHGLGMDIHEAPSVSPLGEGKALTTGHVVTCEPGIYIEGKYGVRIEDMLFFYPDKVVDITKTAKELIEIY